MTVNRVRILRSDTDKKVTLPIANDFDESLGREQLIKLYERSEMQDSVNIVQDFETTRYSPDTDNVDKHIVYDNLLNHLIQSYEEKSKLPIYDKWVGRFVFQTTGHYMIQRVLKKYPMVKKLDILHVINPIKQIEIIGENPLFLDNNASEWY